MEHGRQDYERVIDLWVRNERDRRALKRKYLDGICYEQIADELGISPRTVQNIVNRWRGTVESHLKIQKAALRGRHYFFENFEENRKIVLTYY